MVFQNPVNPPSPASYAPPNMASQLANFIGGFPSSSSRAPVQFISSDGSRMMAK